MSTKRYIMYCPFDWIRYAALVVNMYSTGCEQVAENGVGINSIRNGRQVPSRATIFMYCINERYYTYVAMNRNT